MNSLIHKSAKLSFLSVSALALFMNACEGTAVVGEENDSVDGGDGDGDGDGDVTSNNDFGDLAGTRWEGYVEGGSDVTLILGRDGTGTFLYGEDRNLAPPTDPDKGYFCEWTDSIAPACSPYRLNAGWSYPVHDTVVTGRRVEFRVPVTDPWADWCALQTPQVQQEDPDGTKVYGVGPNFGGGHDEKGCFIHESQGSREKVYVDCGWYMIAQREMACECDATECVAGTGLEGFDLTADADFTELSNVQGMHLFLVE